jgi:Domain of unknown function (DUF4407)
MANLIKKFFWVSSGATIPLLVKCETEHNKYVGIGATVLLTGILAGISAAYALYTVFWSIEWSVAFGLLWGLMIFNLDRFIILSIKKKEYDSSSRWGKRLKERLLDFLSVLPRVGLAILLAFVITKPLELKLFEKEVELEIETMKREDEEKLQASLSAPTNDQTQPTQLTARIKGLNDEIGGLNQTIDNSRKLWEDAERQANCECYGTCGSGRFGVGINCERERGKAALLKKNYETISNTESDVNKQIDDRRIQIKELEDVRKKLESDARRSREGATGLATRLQAFDRLTERNEIYGRANLVIMLIFILLETAPILAKFFSPYGPYDKLLETAELKMSVASMKEQIASVDEAILAQEARGKSREAVMAMQESMVEEIKAQPKSAHVASEQVQAEWNQAKRELIRQAIHSLRRPDGRSNNGSK